MTNLLNYIRALFVAVMVWTVTLTGEAQATELGRTVTNVATMTYVEDGTPVTVQTPPAVFVIMATPSPSTIEFFRYSPNAPDSFTTTINGSDYSPSGDLDGPFTAIGLPGSANFTMGTLMPVIPATTYTTGETMLVRVIDIGQNGDPNRIETVVITVQTDSGDMVTLRLYESGPDTGEFWAYIPSSRASTPINDPALTTGAGTQLTATYVDTFDATEVSVDTALVDPYNRVFNALTGELIDGALIELINVTTGQPAAVFGVDGFSVFPTDVTSGATVSDVSGFSYDVRTGEFRYPFVAQGQYAIRVTPPEGFTFASSVLPDGFDDMNGAPYVIIDASYGETFTLDTSGPIQFDIPLDPISDMAVLKSAEPSFGDVGDFITYKVTVENNGAAGMPVTVQDVLPRGFRYVEGTSRVDGARLADPVITSNGEGLVFSLGALPGGSAFNLTYVAEIGVGATPGQDYFNTAFAVSRDGEVLSNVARAAVTIREDILRSTSTILGRISEQSCDGDADWARDITRGIGVEGVRLYMEDGSYVVTDQDGLYHFEGVTSGTHVVQIDEETLPQGYTPMICEESTRYAGSAISKFVDVQGGGIWRANFYLKQTGEKAVKEETEVFNDITEYKTFDSAWLETQTPETGWVYPSPDRTPSIPSINVGIKHGNNTTVSLYVNNRPVPVENFEARDMNSTRTVMLSRWKGVDIIKGSNAVRAEIKDGSGNVVEVLERDIYFATTVLHASAMPEQSVLVADGRTVPMLAIRLENESGHPIHAGRIVDIDVLAPYRRENQDWQESTAELDIPLAARSGITVGPNGVAKVALEPTLRTGKVSVEVTLDDGRKVPLFMYLKPEKRDWIMVGVAEGSAAYERLKGRDVPMGNTAEDVITDGRIAFFAKGLVKGDWLVTLAVDTAKRRGNRDQDFQFEIDPNAYYTLYGDRSNQQYEASSRYPVYVRIEKSTFHAMFGDFNTDINEGKLTNYQRRLSGFKTEYVGDKIQVVGFAAETNQGFALDEIAADGTSGIYELSNDRLLAQSETVVIETRDRFRPDIVLESKPLVRFLDYTIDYFTGEIIFKLPVPVSDVSFNPNVIVVEYETSEDAERNLTYGGRVQTQILDGKVQIGSTAVHEGGGADRAGAQSNMIGVDMIANVTDTTQMRLEYAVTDNNTDENSGTSNAYLAEIVHTNERLAANAYYRQEDPGYGLGHRNSSTNGVRRYGADVAYKFNEINDAETGRRGYQAVQAKAYQEDNLVTGNSRTTSEVTVSHDSQKYGASLGLRSVKESLETAAGRESILGIASLRYTSEKHGATFQVAHEAPLFNKDSVSAHPARTAFNVDKSLFDNATVTLRHEILSNDDAKANNTAVGVTFSPWAGTDIKASTDHLTQDSARRLGATVGVDQQFKINDKWSASAGFTSRRILEDRGTPIDVAGDAAISPLEVNQDFTAAYLGAAYRADVTSASVRGEARITEDSDRYTVAAGVAREMSEEFSVAGAARGTVTDNTDGTQESRADVRIGSAWRPRDEDMIILNRFDLTYAEDVNGDRRTKVVNNLALNAQVTDRLQTSVNYGAKFIKTEIGDRSYDGYTQLFGAEARWDLDEKWDLGARGSIMHNSRSGNTEYSFGPSIGVSPAENVWISAGYNVVGFEDDDFQAAEYTRDGLYIQFRLKFDQYTARSLLNEISPKDSRIGYRPPSAKN